jgi:hypothetical protein
MSLPVPDNEALAYSAALTDHIADEIGHAGGWISFDRFMELALYAPGMGYYSGGARKFGAAGDFVTAPELSSAFSQTLAAQVAQLMALGLRRIGPAGRRPAARTRTARRPADELRHSRPLGRIARPATRNDRRTRTASARAGELARPAARTL